MDSPCPSLPGPTPTPDPPLPPDPSPFPGPPLPEPAPTPTRPAARSVAVSRPSGHNRPVHPPSTFCEQYKWSLQACSLSLQGWGLIDLLLRASNV